MARHSVYGGTIACCYRAISWFGGVVSTGDPKANPKTAGRIVLIDVLPGLVVLFDQFLQLLGRFVVGRDIVAQVDVVGIIRVELHTVLVPAQQTGSTSEKARDQPKTGRCNLIACEGKTFGYEWLSERAAFLSSEVQDTIR